MHPYPHAYVAAAAGELAWLHLDCQVEGILEPVEQAEQGCLIANSLRGARALDAEVIARQP